MMMVVAVTGMVLSGRHLVVGGFLVRQAVYFGCSSAQAFRMGFFKNTVDIEYTSELKKASRAPFPRGHCWDGCDVTPL